MNLIGTVKWWDAKKKFGFIHVRESGDEIYVHVSGLAPGIKHLSINERVEFRMGQSLKCGRPCAVGVRPPSSVETVLQSMSSMLNYLDNKLAGVPGANEALCQIRFAMKKLETLTNA